MHTGVCLRRKSKREKFKSIYYVPELDVTAEGRVGIDVLLFETTCCSTSVPDGDSR